MQGRENATLAVGGAAYQVAVARLEHLERHVLLTIGDAVPATESPVRGPVMPKVSGAGAAHAVGPFVTIAALLVASLY